MNESKLETLRQLKLFAPKFLIIKSKSGRPTPFTLNRAQQYIDQRLEKQREATGKVRAIVLKGRQQGCCFSPEMRVLNNKYQWVKLIDIKIGDQLFPIDENFNTLRRNQKGHDRKIRTAIVEAKVHLKKEAFEVALSNGVKLIVTGEHRMLFKDRGGCQAEWRQIDKSRIGDEIRAFCNAPDDKLQTFEDGKSLPNSNDTFEAWVRIESIRPIGEIEVIDLQTSTKTYICEGLVSHNSTYIQARYFHKVVTSRGKKAFILTHDKEATKNLFTMANRFYDNLEPGLVPTPDTANAKELYFKQFDSGYSVGTAGNKSVGRSQTIQLFHGSEVGFWQFAEDHAKGILQAISSEAGTEVILESTANGIGNYFHQRWIAAMGGYSEYQAIFVPWYWQPEYTHTADGFSPNEEEIYLMSLYGDDGLTHEHLSWRRIKISDLSKDYDAGLEQFKQEYPFSATEAFLNPISNVFINAKHVAQARKNRVDVGTGNLIIGVDVAISDRDRTAIIRRRGRVAYDLELRGNMNTMEICGLLKRIILQEHPFRVYVDCIGVGAGVVDRMQEMGFDCVEGINVARSANDKEKFKNLRAELWSDMRDWLMQEMPVQIPDDDTLHGDLCSLGFKFTSTGQLQIESKDDLRARGMPSPDSSDALALTMAGGYYGVQQGIEVPKRWPGEERMFS